MTQSQGATDSKKLTISSIVCTRNRGAAAVQPVKSILETTGPDTELIVVDQSTNDETENALAEFRSDPRLRYIRSTTVGLSACRNVGIAAAKTDLIAITDDDVEVEPEWLPNFQEIFTKHPDVAIAFCGVRAAPYDTTAGFIPAYVRPQDALVSTLREKCTARGMGAGLCIRREVIQALGGFDEMLGAGSKLHACEDGDMCVRCIIKGYKAYESSATPVVHYGFRTWAEGKALTTRDWYGIGAAYSKPLKMGYWGFAIIPAYEFTIRAVWPVVRQVLTLKKPSGVKRITCFIQGFFGGLKYKADPKTLLFINPDAPKKS
jgi:GT2 family glycosyltransferase